MTDQPAPDASRFRRFDPICDAFEAAWHRAIAEDLDPPQIERSLEEVPAADQPALLSELLAIEFTFRRQAGESAVVSEYLERFPDERDVVEAAFREMADRPRRGRRFPIRLNCPHCENPIAIVEEAPDEDVVCPSCGSSFRVDSERTVSWSQDKLPKLENFELQEAVGRGAFGTVYRAIDTKLGRTVAVKVPRSGTFATKEGRTRTASSARPAARRNSRILALCRSMRLAEPMPSLTSSASTSQA
jgi:ribosomal protein S27E